VLNLILVAIGGAIGASARYGVSLAVGRAWPGDFPIATLLINIVGSLLMGFLVGLLAKFLPPAQNEIRLFVAVGILGGFTTFSAFSLDAIALIERGEWAQALGYALMSVVLSVGALYLGLIATRGVPV
jgi:fluoride exporter